MPFSGMLRRVALVRIDVAEGRIASIIRVKRLSELEKTLSVPSNKRTSRRILADSFHPGGGGDMFLRNVCPYKSHTA
jgi:hypothetical protein